MGSGGGFKVVTDLCLDCKDTACAEVCPVDCFYEPIPEKQGVLPNQLYIDPEECINCDLCVPACPWHAIVDAFEVPAVFQNATALNARVITSGGERDSFQKALQVKWRVCPQCRARTNDGTPKCGCGVELKHFDPTDEELANNYTKWGYAPQ